MAARGRARVKHDFVGKDPAVLAAAIGMNLPAQTPLLFGETNEDHPFVQTEQMMPFVPVVRVGCIDDGIRAAVKAEHGFHHTALIHSRNAENATKMARADEHNDIRPKRPLFCQPGQRRPGLPELQRGHADRRRRHHAINVYAPALHYCGRSDANNLKAGTGD